MGVQLLYNVVLVSATLQHEPAVCIHIFLPFQTSFPFRSPQRIQQSSLCLQDVFISYLCYTQHQQCICVDSSYQRYFKNSSRTPRPQSLAYWSVLQMTSLLPTSCWQHACQNDSMKTYLISSHSNQNTPLDSHITLSNNQLRQESTKPSRPALSASPSPVFCLYFPFIRPPQPCRSPCALRTPSTSQPLGFCTCWSLSLE